MHRVIIYLLLFLQLQAFAQNPKPFWRLIEKNKWEDAAVKVDKALAKDSLNPFYRYFQTWLVVNDSTRQQHIDSSYASILKTASYFAEFENDKQKRKWAKADFDSLQIAVLKAQIEKLAYDSASLQDTEETYRHFLNIYSETAHQQSAVSRRNELAYAKAVAQNTPEAFENFYRKYPDAEQVKDAKEFYEARLYEEKTKDKRLESYEKFLMQYPNTPFRSDAEHQIFLIRTAVGTAESFQEFAKLYPDSEETKEAWLWFYFLADAPSKLAFLLGDFGQYSFLDSLHQLYKLEQPTLFPILENGQFYFMTETGIRLPNLQLSNLATAYQCGQITDALIAAQNNAGITLFNRAGKLIKMMRADSVHLMHKGFVKFIKGDQESMFHLTDPENALLTNQKIDLLQCGLLVSKNDHHWAFYSPTGIQLTGFQYDEIKEYGKLLFIRKNNKWAITSAEEIARAADQAPPVLRFEFDSLNWLNDQLLLLHQEGKQAVRNTGGHEIIPFEKQEIKLTEHALLVKKVGKTAIHHHSGAQYTDQTFDSLLMNSTFVFFLKDKKWAVVNHTLTAQPRFAYDSVKLISTHFTQVYKSDSSFLMGHSDSLIFLADKTTFRIIKSPQQAVAAKDFSEFLIVQPKANWSAVYNDRGQLIFEGEKVSFAPLDQHHLSITKNNKKGIMDKKGKLVLEVSKEAIANYTDRMVATLEKQKFGAFDFVTGKHIPNEYNQMLERYTGNDSIFVARKEDKRGLISVNNKEIYPFSFEEIKPLNDSLTFVKVEEGWQIVNIFTKKNFYTQPIRQFYPFTKASILAYSEKGYGVIATSGQWIVPPAYNEIINVGSEQNPVYMCEKSIPEASYYVMVYYNAAGEIIFRNAYTQEEFDLIYCDIDQ